MVWWTEEIIWCLTHRSPIDEESGCYWDRLVGHRPGRGECKPVPATITVQETDYSSLKVTVGE